MWKRGKGDKSIIRTLEALESGLMSKIIIKEFEALSVLKTTTTTKIIII